MTLSKKALCGGLALILCGCMGGSPGSTGSALLTADIKPRYTYTDSTAPFEYYSFNFSAEERGYIVSVRPSEKGAQLVVEDNAYRITSYEITPPEGYRVLFPDKAVNSAQAVNIIRNDLNDTVTSDLMEFSYISETAEKDIIGQYYTIDRDGGLKAIEIFDRTVYGGSHSACLDRVHLNHTEPEKFIYEITVGDFMGEDGKLIPPSDRVSIKTMTYDPIQYRMMITEEPITPANPLYFGYAYQAAANAAAQYFTVELMPGLNRSEYIEVTNNDDTEFYYSTNSRFRSMDELRKFLDSVFTSTLTSRLVTEAPQNYIDYHGKLWSKDSVREYNTSYGMITFTNFEVSERSMLFRSRQETYDENGNFTGYTDGGNFIISSLGNDDWRVVQYRFPYL